MRVTGANFVVTGSSCGRSSVLGNVLSNLTIEDHSTHEVGVVVSFVVHNSENLALDTNLLRKPREIPEDLDITENTI
jgi:hypothetical protein